jgi:hypothetical protein
LLEILMPTVERTMMTHQRVVGKFCASNGLSRTSRQLAGRPSHLSAVDSRRFARKFLIRYTRRVVWESRNRSKWGRLARFNLASIALEFKTNDHSYFKLAQIELSAPRPAWPGCSVGHYQTAFGYGRGSWVARNI